MQQLLATATARAAGPDEQGGAPVWDLGDLFAGRDDPGIEALLAEADREAGVLAEAYRGKLGQTGGDGLVKLIEGYEACEEKLGRVMSFASLLHAAQRDDVEVGRFFQGIQERVNGIETKLLFVTLELNRIEDDALEARLAESEAAPGVPALAARRPELSARTSSTTRSSASCTRSTSPAVPPGSGSSTRRWPGCAFRCAARS